LSKDKVYSYYLEMFPNKERHWITGPFYSSIYYDTWIQWIESFVYKHWAYIPLLWNIKETNTSASIQIIYCKQDGDFQFICVNIQVDSSNESMIQEWLNTQKWLHLT